MTPAGDIQIPVLALQLSASVIATWIGIRVVDDVRLWLSKRTRVQDDQV